MKFNAICIIFFLAYVSGTFGANVRRKREENNPEVSSKIDVLTVDKSPEEIDFSNISPVDESSFDELLNDNLDQLSSSEIKFLTETSSSSKEENLSVVPSNDSVSSKDKKSSDDSFTEASTSSESKISGDDTSVESSISSERENTNKDYSVKASTSSETKGSDEDSSISASTSSKIKNSGEDSSVESSASSESKNSGKDSSEQASTSSESKDSSEDSSKQASTSSESKDSSEDSSKQASTSSESKESSEDSSKHVDKSTSSEVKDASDEDSSEIQSHERQTKCPECEVTTQKPKQTTTQIYLDPKVQNLNIALYFALQKMNRKILFGHEIQFESLVKILALTYKIENAGGSVIDLNKLMLRTVASFYPQSLKDAMITGDF